MNQEVTQSRTHKNDNASLGLAEDAEALIFRSQFSTLLVG